MSLRSSRPRFAFWSSKVLLTAVDLSLFTRLGDRALTGAELGAELGLHPRGTYDFFDALVAMGFLERDGDGRRRGTGTTPPDACTSTARARATSAACSRC
jgi:hypothetical protein